MMPIRNDSRIEIWCANYINDKNKRSTNDKNVKVIQIEHGYDNDYIVEIVDETKKGEMIRFDHL